MREILFRGKRTDYDEWVCGQYFTEIGRGINGCQNDIIHFIKDSFGTQIVIPETIGQFTGLTDKNGVKIFEGDVLLIPDFSRGAFFGMKQPKCKTVIKYGLQFNGHGFYGTHHNKEEIEIIGNIHDNPELIKQ